MSTDVTLTNSFGDHMHGHRYTLASDEPPIIRVNGVALYENVWQAKGWVISDDVH